MYVLPFFGSFNFCDDAVKFRDTFIMHDNVRIINSRILHVLQEAYKLRPPGHDCHVQEQFLRSVTQPQIRQFNTCLLKRVHRKTAPENVILCNKNDHRRRQLPVFSMLPGLKNRCVYQPLIKPASLRDIIIFSIVLHLDIELPPVRRSSPGIKADRTPALRIQHDFFNLDIIHLDIRFIKDDTQYIPVGILILHDCQKQCKIAQIDLSVILHQNAFFIFHTHPS